MHKLALFAGKAALVLKEKTVSDEGPTFVHLKAREAGLFSFIKTLLGINSSIEVDINLDHISMKEKNASGYFINTTPISKVSNVGFGFMRPVILLVIAIVVALASLYLSSEMDETLILIIGLVIAGAFLLCYYLRKSMCIYWSSDGGTGGFILLKRSVIENVSLTEKEAEKICSIVHQLIQNANQR